jgi:small-conductance mechanosensitive channel
VRRHFDASRLFFPLIVSLVLFAGYWPFRNDSLYVLGGDVLPYVQFAAYTALIFFFVRLLDLLVFDVVVSGRRNVAAPQLLRGIVSIALYAILLISAFNGVFKINVTGLLTGGAVLAAVLALALQDTLGNLFAGIALHMEQTYEIGDVVHTGDYMGVVEGVSWRATRLRGFNNQLVVVPNSVVARERLEIFPRHNLNARVIMVSVDYNVAPATVIGILTQVASHVEGVARERPCFARVS